jgi:hypothetical protein
MPALPARAGIPVDSNANAEAYIERRPIMQLRHPVQTLAGAITNAIESELVGLESHFADDLLTSQSGHLTVRPRIEDCGLVVFTQVWQAADLGFVRGADPGGVEAETVVITGPAGDACVYVGMQLLYHVAHPNRRFFLDVAAQCMRAKAHCGRYEGRDNEDEEAFDYEVAGTVARACTAIRLMHQPDAERVARMLRDCAERVEAAGRGVVP